MKEVVDFIKQLTPLSKILLLLGSLLFLYGFFAEAIPINFFWESGTFGVIIFLLGCTVFLKNEYKKLTPKSIGRRLVKGAMIFVILIIGITTVMIIAFGNLEVVHAAKSELAENEVLINDIGQIESFSYISSGQIRTRNNKEGHTGDALLEILVKGTKKYRKVTVFMLKEKDNDWKLIEFD